MGGRTRLRRRPCRQLRGMNVVHRLYCRSGRWRARLEDLLPWATEGVALAHARVLEIGSGPGPTTDWLVPRVDSLATVVTYPSDAPALAALPPQAEVRRAHATDLPFVSATFDVVVCFTMLHHVPTVALQDRLFTEAARVLRPGGIFAGSDSRWGPLFAVAHLRDTMRLVDPRTLPERLAAAGLSGPSVQVRGDAFRFRATA